MGQCREAVGGSKGLHVRRADARDTAENTPFCAVSLVTEAAFVAFCGRLDDHGECCRLRAEGHLADLAHAFAINLEGHGFG